LGSLFRREFRRVIYLTDRLAHTGTDLEVLEVGAEPAPSVYPLAAVFQEQDKSFRVRIPRSELEIRTEGLYRVTASLEGGTLDFFLPLWQPRGPLLEARALPRGARLARPQSGATCYAFTTPAGLGVLNLPPEEFFPLLASPRSPPPPPPL
jgi:hypothetical protein